jgi:hypothetical protein
MQLITYSVRPLKIRKIMGGVRKIMSSAARTGRCL